MGEVTAASVAMTSEFEKDDDGDKVMVVANPLGGGRERDRVCPQVIYMRSV